MQLQVSLLLTVLAVAALAHGYSVSDRNELRRKQESIACDLRNATIERQFATAVRSRHGDPNSRIFLKDLGEYYFNTPVLCRDNCVNRCSRVNGVTWCLNLYHPSEHIEMCLNLTSGEMNGTDYAWRLGLDEFLHQETVSPQDSNLRLNNPLYVLSGSMLTFNVQSPDCNATTFYDVNIRRRNEDSRAPNVTIHGSNKLILGQRNSILCTVEFYGEQSNGRPSGAFGAWYVNGSTFDIGYLDSDCNPLEDTDLSCYETTNRVDFISLEYVYSICPRRIYQINHWMIIENATEEDAMLTYECRAGYESTNPITLIHNITVGLSFVPVYPSIDIVTLETPVLPPGLAADAVPTFFLKEDEHVHWSCSVLAGVEDILVWTLNGVELPTFSDAKENLSCASSSRDVFVVSQEAVDLGDYERQLNSTLIICGASDFTTGLYECVVNHTKDNAFNVTKVWSANVVQSLADSRLILFVSIGCSLALLLSVAASMLLCCVCFKQQRRKQQQREKDWNLDIFVTEDVLHIKGKCTSPVLKPTATSFAFHTVDPLEFPRNKLVFLNSVLGKGTFGVVLQAKAEDIVKSAPQRNIVAVKTPRSKAPPHEIDNFWEELQLMKHILPHSNVVNLLGYCTTQGGPIYMIIEYARYGSMKDFLRECEQIVLQLNHLPHVLCKSHQYSTSYSSSSASSAYPQLVDKMQLCAQNSVFTPDNTSTPTTATPTTASQGGTFQFPPAKPWGMTRERLTTQDSGFYGETGDISPQEASNDSQCGVAHSIAPLTHDYVNSKGLLYMEDIQNFALQIACGLKHLEESQIVHCDLAARNILIAEGFVLKIGDFGMARDVSEKEYYRKQGGRIPVKWTAPEALKDHIFTYKSDIWSFGVVLWEILTYGQQPYPKLKVRHSWESFIKYLMEGNRLPQPKGCPDNFYDLMLSCWHSSSDQRPSAEDLVQFLSQKNLLPINNTGVDSTTVHSSDPDKTLHTTESSLSPQCHV